MLDDYAYLKKAHAKADPKGVDMDQYSSSAQAPSCPDVGKAWQAASQLPPTPDKDLCKCMVDSLDCVVDSNLSEKSYGDLFGEVCGSQPKVCAGILGNTELGNYGAYSMCSPAEKLAYVLNAYYQANGKTSSSCGWKGAKLQKGSTASSCEKGLNNAAEQNKAIATATANVAAPKSTGGSSSGKGDKDSFGVRSAPAGVFAAGAVAAAAAVFSL